MQIDLNYTVDIAYPIKPQDLKHPLYYLDSGAHVIRVTLLRNGVPLTLTEEARCFGFFLHEATEVTDMSEGTVSDGNMLEVTIPELAYATPGVIYFTIRVTDDGATTTVLAITGNVRSTISGTVIDVAGTLLPNLEELIAAFRYLEEISDSLLSAIDYHVVIKPDLSSTYNGYPTGLVGSTIGFSSSNATRTYKKITWVEAGASYSVRITNSASPSSSNLRVARVANENDTVVQTIDVPTTAGETNTIRFTADASGWLYLPVDINATSVSLSGGFIRDQSSNFANVEHGIASKNYNVGDIIIVDGQLYKTTSDITAGDTITPGTNASAINVADCIVRHDTAQALTDTQKATARVNIGAASYDQGYISNLLAMCSKVHGSGTRNGRSLSVDGCIMSKTRVSGTNSVTWTGMSLLGNTFRVFDVADDSLDGLPSSTADTDFVPIPEWMQVQNIGDLVLRLFVDNSASRTESVLANSRIGFCTKDSQGNVIRSLFTYPYGKDVTIGMNECRLAELDRAVTIGETMTTFWETVVANGNFALYYVNTNSQAGNDLRCSFGIYWNKGFHDEWLFSDIFGNNYDWATGTTAPYLTKEGRNYSITTYKTDGSAYYVYNLTGWQHERKSGSTTNLTYDNSMKSDSFYVDIPAYCKDERIWGDAFAAKVGIRIRYNISKVSTSTTNNRFAFLIYLRRYNEATQSYEYASLVRWGRLCYLGDSGVVEIDLSGSSFEVDNLGIAANLRDYEQWAIGLWSFSQSFGINFRIDPYITRIGDAIDAGLTIAHSPFTRKDYGGGFVGYIAGTNEATYLNGDPAAVCKNGNAASLNGSYPHTTTRIIRLSGNKMINTGSSTFSKGTTSDNLMLKSGKVYRLTMRVLGGGIKYRDPLTAFRTSRLCVSVHDLASGTTNGIILAPQIGEKINDAKYELAGTYTQGTTYYVRVVMYTNSLGQQIWNFNNVTISVEATTTATSAYEIGMYVDVGGSLYKVTADVAIDDTLEVGTNITETTPETEGWYQDRVGAVYPLTYSTDIQPANDSQIGFCFYTNGEQLYNNLIIDWGVEEICDGSAKIDISGTTPSIVAVDGARYICGTLNELTFTPSESGICSVRFVAGSNMVLTLPNTVKMPDWWSASSIVQGRTYEISIEDGVYGVVTSWA